MKIERAFTDQMFFPFLVCQVTNGVYLLKNTCQIGWHQGHDKTNKIHKTFIFGSVSELVVFPDHI